MHYFDKSFTEVIRALTRPALLLLMGVGTFLFITGGADSEFATWWMRIFFAGAAEWIVERPILKVLKKGK